MIKCPKCGAEQVTDTPKFCSECGHNFNVPQLIPETKTDDIEEKLTPFHYEDLGDGRYSILRVEDKFVENVEIPEGVVELQTLAFSGCTLLRSVTLPKSLLVVRDSAFSGCSALEEVIFLGEKCTIGTNVFSDCSELKKVALPSALTEISASMFNGASSLENLVIPVTVKKICNFAFRYTSIKCLSLPTSVVFLEGCALVDVKKVRYEGTKAQWKRIETMGNPLLKPGKNTFSITYAGEDITASSNSKEPASKTKNSRAKKSKAKKTDEKTKEDLLWEIRVCEEAITAKQKSLSIKAGDVFAFLFQAICTSAFFAVVLIFLLRRQSGVDISHVIILALVLGGIATAIFRHAVLSGNTICDKDLLEVLSERLRIAKLCLAALEAGMTPSENEKKYRLTFADSADKKCGNCAYMGKVMRETTETYSDGTTSTSTSVDHYFCGKMGDQKVKKSNVCDNYFSKRVAGAFDAANKYYEETAQSLLKGDQRKANGFR